MELVTKSTRRQVALDDLAEGDADEVAILVQHRVEGVDVAQPADDLQLLLMQRIADEVALDGQRILHEASRVEGADRLMMGDAGGDDLAAARPAGHEMRLDQPRGDSQFRLGETPVDLDRGAAGFRDAQIDMGSVIPGEMVFDTDLGQHPGVADQLGKLLTLVRPMQPGRDQHSDPVQRNAFRDHGLDYGAQE